MAKKKPRNKNKQELSPKSGTKPKRIYKKKVVKSRVPKTRNGGKWTEAMFWQNIRSSLRNRTRYWYPRLKCLEDARRPNESLNKRLKWEFKCSNCLNWFPQTQVEAHHSTPAGQLKCAEDLPGFVERLFSETGWVCICKVCHKKHHDDEKVNIEKV